VIELISARARVLFIDESMFTSRLLHQKVWCHRGEAPSINGMNRVSFDAIALLAAINTEGEVVKFALHPKFINVERFNDFLSQIASESETTYVFLDNLRVHRSKLVRDHASKLRIELIFNSAYSSPFNPIERLFAYAKRSFGKSLLANSQEKK
jgi:hypothetical protein